MEQKIIGNVTLTSDTLQKLLARILKDDLPEKDDYIRVLTESLQSSEPACRYLFKVHLGEQLPQTPEIGAVGFIAVDKVGWNLLYYVFLIQMIKKRLMMSTVI